MKHEIVNIGYVSIRSGREVIEQFVMDAHGDTEFPGIDYSTDPAQMGGWTTNELRIIAGWRNAS